jgi:hypothetical protein
MAAQDDMGQESITTLLDLQRRWHALLADRLEEYVDAALPGEEAEATRAAYRDTVQAHLALRLVLEEFATHPALALPRRWEHIMLANAAGVSGPFSRNRDAAAAGAMLVADLRPQPSHPGTPSGRPRPAEPSGSAAGRSGHDARPR